MSINRTAGLLGKGEGGPHINTKVGGGGGGGEGSPRNQASNKHGCLRLET